MNTIAQLNAKKARSEKMDLIRIYSTPGLFLGISEENQAESIRVYTKKEWKRLKKTRKKK